MKLTSVKWISKEDLPGAPDWIDRLLDPINLVFDEIQRALNRGLTFGDNVAAQIKSLTVKAGAAATDNTVSFLPTLKTRPQGVILMGIQKANVNYSPIASAVFIEWTFDGTNINITSMTGLTNGMTYNFTVMVV